MFISNALFNLLQLLHPSLGQSHKARALWQWNASNAAATFSLTLSLPRAKCPYSMLPQMVCISRLFTRES
jgi:hypothetical protein